MPHRPFFPFSYFSVRISCFSQANLAQLSSYLQPLL
jgi:hypothetical protein